MSFALLSTSFCSIHCDGLTHPDGNEAGVAVESFTRGADGADAVPACVALVVHQMILQRGGVSFRADSVSGEALELVLDELGLDNYPVTCGISLKLE